MRKEYYDRYQSFRVDGDIQKIPKIKIDKADTDLYIVYDKSKNRLDNLSYKYYGDANYGWLLMLANPKYGSLEFEIPDGALYRIPYPIDSALYRYETRVNEYLGK